MALHASVTTALCRVYKALSRSNRFAPSDINVCMHCFNSICAPRLESDLQCIQGWHGCFEAGRAKRVQGNVRFERFDIFEGAPRIKKLLPVVEAHLCPSRPSHECAGEEHE